VIEEREQKGEKRGRKPLWIIDSGTGEEMCRLVFSANRDLHSRWNWIKKRLQLQYKRRLTNGQAFELVLDIIEAQENMKP